MADTGAFYARNTVDETLNEGDHHVKIEEPAADGSNTYTVSGPSKGVDVVAVLRYKGLGPGEQVDAAWVILDNDEKAGTDHVERHARQAVTLHGGASATVGQGVAVPFKGSVPKPKETGHRTMLRLRVRVPAGRSVTITTVEITGWVLPA